MKAIFLAAALTLAAPTALADTPSPAPAPSPSSRPITLSPDEFQQVQAYLLKLPAGEVLPLLGFLNQKQAAAQQAAAPGAAKPVARPSSPPKP